MTEYGPDFEAVIRRLRKRRFCRRPFRVSVVPAAEITRLVQSPGNASCYLEGRIYIAKGMAYAAAVDALLHEFAHHLDMVPSRPHPRNFHRKSWGEKYARVFEFIHEEEKKDA